MHLAKIKHQGKEKQVAIKILRPDIEKLFNEELDGLCCLHILLKTLFLKQNVWLVEVVHL